MKSLPFLLPLLLLGLGCTGPDPEKLKGSEWFCVDTTDPEESGTLSYPDPANPGPTNFREVYGKDGSYQVFDVTTGQSLLGTGVEKARYNLKTNQDGELILTVDLFVLDGKWTSEEERIPYIVKELTDSRFHAIAQNYESTSFFNESMCVRWKEN